MNERIAARRKSEGLSQADLARRVGISSVAVGKWESGLNQPKGRYINDLANALGVSVRWLLTGEQPTDGNAEHSESDIQLISNVKGADLGVHKVPVLTYVQAGCFHPCEDRGVGEGVYEYITADLDASSNAFAVWVQGNSMEPDFNDGDLIIVDPDLVPMPGDFVVAKNGSEEATFKKYRPRGYKEDGTEVFELVPLNEDYPKLSSETCPITIIGKVIEHRKFFKRRK